MEKGDLIRKPIDGPQDIPWTVVYQIASKGPKRTILDHICLYGDTMDILLPLPGYETVYIRTKDLCGYKEVEGEEKNQILLARFSWSD